MKKSKLWILLSFISIVGLTLILTGCFLGPGFQTITSGANVSGYVHGITNNATVIIKDDLGESTTTGPNSSSYYYGHPYYYGFSVKPGVRILTYSCTGYATIVKKVSVVGQTTLNVTMNPIAKGSDSK